MLSWLRLIRSRRVGPGSFQRLLAEYGSAAAALEALPQVAHAAGISGYAPASRAEAEAEMDAAHAAGAWMLCLGDPRYPPALAAISDAPPVLWCRGRPELLAAPAVAVVGARNASSLGLRMARAMALGLGEAGFVVVSGLARGIDTAAHDAALTLAAASPPPAASPARAAPVDGAPGPGGRSPNGLAEAATDGWSRSATRAPGAAHRPAEATAPGTHLPASDPYGSAGRLSDHPADRTGSALRGFAALAGRFIGKPRNPAPPPDAAFAAAAAAGSTRPALACDAPGTIAVLAGGVDVIYPAENAPLAARIAAEGLLMSEQPMGLAPQARHFPRRNRLVSGLSLGVVVIEAATRSGTLITAQDALDQGREVMAVPGHPFDSRAGGCNALIRDGATLVRSAADVGAALSQRFGPAVLPRPPTRPRSRPNPGPHSAPTSPAAAATTEPPAAARSTPGQCSHPPASRPPQTGTTRPQAASPSAPPATPHAGSARGPASAPPSCPVPAPARRTGHSAATQPPAPGPPPSANGLAGSILALLGPSPLAEDQLIRDLALPAARVAPALMLLELEGRIIRQPGGLLARAQ